MKNKVDFDKTFQSGRYLRGGLFSVVFRPNCRPVTRIGISASPRNFSSMVSRNRFRRLVKEAGRTALSSSIPAGYDIIFISRKQTKKRLHLDEVLEEARRLLKKAGLIKSDDS